MEKTASAKGGDGGYYLEEKAKRKNSKIIRKWTLGGYLRKRVLKNL